MKARNFFCSASLTALLMAAARASAVDNTVSAKASPTNAPAWLTQPLALKDCIDLALKQNSTVLKSLQDIEAAFGVSVQARAITIPKLGFTSSYRLTDRGAIEDFGFPGAPRTADQTWQLGIQLTQSIYEGGRLKQAGRIAELTRDQALFGHQTVVQDTVLTVRVAYDDTLLAEQQIVVQEASVKLLQKELDDTARRFEAGTVPRFNVLRAEVELANTRPRLIRARNAHRIAKNNLALTLGYNLPQNVWEDIPLTLTGKLEAQPYDLELPVALARAIEGRTELVALRKTEQLRKEDILTAESGRKPSAQLFVGATSQNQRFANNPTRDISGWNMGAQMSWNIFDGRLTKGKVQEAQAQHRKAGEEINDVSRRIELEVRTAYSNFIEAKEVLESQKKVQEQAEEALRLANARAEAGTGTQLDVLNAQTSLTEARTTQILALHDYSVAKSRLERAVGMRVEAEKK
ncbi:MAG: TolC family protein [Verrucomicrobia bacterium]|nr:TolC family protein [Verrucomicrobiota bacterium]